MIADVIKKRRLELGYTTHTLANILGVGQGTITSWERGDSKPSQLNLAKLSRAFGWNEDVRLNLLRMSEKKYGARLKLTKEFYDILHELEDEFGAMTCVPEDNERLFKLRVMVGAETKKSQGYSKKKVDEVRIRNNISRRDISVSLGYSPGWFTSTFINGATMFTRRQALVFAEFFGVEVEEFEE